MMSLWFLNSIGTGTYNIYSPYPEEFNRQAVGIISQYNFAPTQMAADNLIKEGKDKSYSQSYSINDIGKAVEILGKAIRYSISEHDNEL